ncbi:hypothetical protein P615_06295 [Brevibacillus laterosporus PE36]|nr:hypothetical protein P615_06295 [Brevibacillus laterosporus PE36]
MLSIYGSSFPFFCLIKGKGTSLLDGRRFFLHMHGSAWLCLLYKEEGGKQ